MSLAKDVEAAGSGLRFEFQSHKVINSVHILRLFGQGLGGQQSDATAVAVIRRIYAPIINHIMPCQSDPSNALA
jgi:hypothetical protein